MRIKFFELTLFQRIIGGLLAAGLVVLALFFFFFFMAAAAVLLGAGALRLLWMKRQLRKQQQADVIEGTYRVERKEERLPVADDRKARVDE
jgi:hypothetical protein